MTIGAIVTIIATVLIIAVMAYAARREYVRRQIRASYGPEYDQVRADYGGTRAADRELARRAHLHGKLHLQEISAADQDFYATSWDHVQGGFLDAPAVAVTGAGQLVNRLLTDRGYPAAEAGDDGERLALLSVQHGRLLSDYRHARSVSERVATDPSSVSTEEERTALMQYRAFFEDVLGVPGAKAPRSTKGLGTAQPQGG